MRSTGPTRTAAHDAWSRCCLARDDSATTARLNPGHRYRPACGEREISEMILKCRRKDASNPVSSRLSISDMASELFLQVAVGKLMD
jgi:hypothetical protein